MTLQGNDPPKRWLHAIDETCGFLWQDVSSQSLPQPRDRSQLTQDQQKPERHSCSFTSEEMILNNQGVLKNWNHWGDFVCLGNN